MFEFNLLEYCRENSFKHDRIYVYFGIFIGLSVALTTTAFDQDIYYNYISIIHVLQVSALFMSIAFVGHRFWPKNLKNRYIGLMLHIVIFFVLTFLNTLFVLIHNFSYLALLIFTINIMMVSVLLRWKGAIAVIFAGIICTLYYI